VLQDIKLRTCTLVKKDCNGACALDKTLYINFVLFFTIFIAVSCSFGWSTVVYYAAIQQGIDFFNREGEHPPDR
jgi:hypothetical protein